MKKLFIMTVAVALMAMTGSALATEARIQALGGDVAPYICDDANVYSWYATLPSYSNLMIIGMWNDWEYDDGDDVEAYYGLTYALGDEGSWGTLAIGLMENTPGPNTEAWLANWIRNQNGNIGPWNDMYIFDGNLTNVFMLMYGKQLEGMSFGIFFSRAAEVSLYEETDEDDEEHLQSYTTIGLGFRMDIGENWVADMAFDYTVAGYLNTEVTGDDMEADPGRAIALRGRFFWDWKEDIKLILPYFNFEMKDFAYNHPSYADEYTNTGYGLKSTAMTFGIGANMNVNEDNMILFAIEPFAYWAASPSGYADNFEEEWDLACVTMPKFILALESDLTDWLTFRTGCSKSNSAWAYSYKDGDYEEVEGNSDTSWSEFAWNIGLGFHFGDFDIDCLLNKDVPFSMGYWLTGYQNNYDNETTPVGMISAVYHF